MTVVTTILGIIGAILLAFVILRGYFMIGLFLGSFIVDDPGTPIIFGYLVALFWPIFIALILVCAIIMGIVSFIDMILEALFQ